MDKIIKAITPSSDTIMMISCFLLISLATIGIISLFAIFGPIGFLPVLAMFVTYLFAELYFEEAA